MVPILQAAPAPMSPATTPSIPDAALMNGVLEGVARDLGTMLGHDLAIGKAAVERVGTRPAGRGRVHISFKLALAHAGGPERHGALLVPLPDAIAMACHLLMIPPESIAARREETSLDAATKDALLEVGSMLASASQTAFALLGAAGWTVRSDGCQGVRADVRPAFPYVEGHPLLVARAAAELAPFPAFELVLMLPPLE
jgi:hypothetical protein